MEHIKYDYTEIVTSRINKMKHITIYQRRRWL